MYVAIPDVLKTESSASLMVSGMDTLSTSECSVRFSGGLSQWINVSELQWMKINSE